jgi:beta-lactam-binding protein with PASTA domain
MIRFFRLLAQVLVLIIVALASTLISMRFAIHGREVAVPDFRGMLPAEAERVAFERGLELSRSDHFYSVTIPAGRIVSQQPEPGTRVRRGWRVQAAESLGAQLIDIPAVLGMSPRAAEINIRRRGLELGASAELPTADAPPLAIIAQTPAPGAQGVGSPRVGLLYAVAPPERAYAMPDLTGMTLADATELIEINGLKTSSVTSPAPDPLVHPNPRPSANPRSPVNSHPSANPSPAVSPASIVIGQSPASGTRVAAGASVSLQLSRQ